MSSKNQTAKATVEMAEDESIREPLIESYKKLNEKCDAVLVKIAKKKRNKNTAKADE